MVDTTRFIVLTGPPAGGKSTVCDLFEDIGVPTVSTGDGIRREAETRFDDPDEDDIWSVAEQIRENQGPAGPTVVCEHLIASHIEDNDVIVVSDLREEAEVEWLRDAFDIPVLIVRVDTRNAHERMRRYVDREVGNLGTDEPVPYERERELREQLYERERREAPYPRHHVTLLNDDTVRTDELMCRIQGLCEFIDPTGGYDAGIAGDTDE